MGKKSKGSPLGRALIKDRFSSRRPKKSNDSLLHTSELNDGYDWGRLNLQSVTEQNSFEEFLSTAQLAGTEFQAEKLNITFVNPDSVVQGVSQEDREKFERKRREKKKIIRIPRRPKWDGTTTKEELHNLEKETFLNWRRDLAVLQEKEGLELTPYERNLEFWRQLWRVIERSDVVVQIVDARNPLLFRCEDLESYVSDLGKSNLLLVNKADLLSQDQREAWANWFSKNDVEAVFFSAKEAAIDDSESIPEITTNESSGAKEIYEEEDEVYLDADEGREIEEEEEEFEDALSSSCESDSDGGYEGGEESEGEGGGKITTTAKALDHSKTPLLVGVWKEAGAKGRLLGRSELVSLFESFDFNRRGGDGSNEGDNYPTSKLETRRTTVGLVGYPNVGKSSTINCLIGSKKVSVSATPGKTKHFQTINLSNELVLCDCPGLVMPSLAESKASMVLGGILPADRGGDLREPVALLAALLGRPALESAYGLMIPLPPEGDDPLRHPTPEEFLGVYAYSRGFMTAGGRADTSRAARYVVKDFINGRLIHVRAPPGTEQHDFDKLGKSFLRPDRPVAPITAQTLRATQMVKPKAAQLDEDFFKKMSLGSHTKGISRIPSNVSEGRSMKTTGKAWKDHSDKRNKREKLRRVYRHLDE